ncbi:MAG: dihydrolipoamide acyltransferase [Actinobacteria bacterium]|jgi:pyruvate/2-oxoglutarate dehydrogenase complex dihydrolipoamide acyltransferase (E2) component|nr:dihydrolipoamide acyltransferase [Actinomycetota bacterium]NCG38057.1 dihydrolipoamide acyltransferase [Actinomycetota bacterium]
MGTSDPPIDVRIPHSGLVEEAVVLEWLVDDGQVVEAGVRLVVIELEKINLEIESPASGRIVILVPASDTEVVVGTTIAQIYA